MSSKLVIGALLGCGAFVAAATLGAVVGIAAFPPRWRGTSQIVVDWGRMPIEASGDERGFKGKFMRELLTDGVPALRDTFAHDRAVQSRLGASERQLLDAVELRASRESSGTRVRIDVTCTDADQSRCEAIQREATEHVTRNFETYRTLEGLGQLYTQGREADETGEDGLLWLKALSVVASDPVTITQKPSVELEFNRSIIVSALLAWTFGVGATVVTVVAFAIVARKRAKVDAS